MKRLLFAILTGVCLLAGSTGLDSCRQNPMWSHDTVMVAVHDTVHTLCSCDSSLNLLTNGGFNNANPSATTHDISDYGDVTGWTIYRGTPQYGGGPGGDGHPGYIQMWGNSDQSDGEGISQTLASPITSGKSYVVSADIDWMNDNAANYTPYTRVRFTAYNDNGQSEIIAKLQVTNTTWQHFTASAWTSHGTYNHFAITVEDDNIGVNSACWAHIDNVSLTAH